MKTWTLLLFLAGVSATSATNICSCTNGVAATGTACTTNSANICTSCSSYHLSGTSCPSYHLSGTSCVANPCSCETLQNEKAMLQAEKSALQAEKSALEISCVNKDSPIALSNAYKALPGRCSG